MRGFPLGEIVSTEVGHHDACHLHAGWDLQAHMVFLLPHHPTHRTGLDPHDL